MQAAEQESASCSQSHRVLPLGCALLQAAASLPAWAHSGADGCSRGDLLCYLVWSVLKCLVCASMIPHESPDWYSSRISEVWGCRSLTWAHPAVCTLWPGNRDPHIHRKGIAHIIHNLTKTKTDFHRVCSSPAFIKGTVESPALLGLYCILWRKDGQVLFHKLLDLYFFSFKPERTVLITLHVIHMYNLHKSMKIYTSFNAKLAGVADSWEEVPGCQMRVDFGVLWNVWTDIFSHH